MLYCTGAPKTGTHLLLKALHLFGEDGQDAIHSHKDYNSKWSAEDKRVHIIRNPRNTLISWVRYVKLERNERTIIKSMDFMIRRMSGHVGWLNEPHCLTVRFEELLSDPKVLLLDECFAALDVLTIKMLQEIIVNLQTESNITICICDHQARDLLSCVDVAVILSNCKIVAQGSPNELINNTEAKNAYFGDSFKFN